MSEREEDNTCLASLCLPYRLPTDADADEDDADSPPPCLCAVGSPVIQYLICRGREGRQQPVGKGYAIDTIGR